MKKSKIQLEWNKSADAWLDFVRTGKDHCRYYMNNPGMFKLLGNIRRKKILDLACGEGYNSRIMAKKGAEVISVDFSKNQIKHAIEAEKINKLGIKYYVCNAADLRCFKEKAFDIVACFMALQDMDNYKKAIAEVRRVLKRNGRFGFTIPHPCFEKTIYRDGKFYRDERYFKNKLHSTYKCN